jgi:HEPN domain-containing protein
MPANQTYQEWLSKASEDTAVGKEIVSAGHFPSPACFRFQQAAEKYLKAALLFHGKEFPRTHDLAVLSKLLSEVLPDIANVEQELQLLARYSVETRYPGDYPEVGLPEAHLAEEAVQKVANLITSKIK